MKLGGENKIKQNKIKQKTNKREEGKKKIVWVVFVQCAIIIIIIIIKRSEFFVSLSYS